MKDEHQLLLDLAISIFGSLISDIPDIRLKVAVGVIIFLCGVILILYFKIRSYKISKEIEDKLKFVNKLHDVGIIECDLSIEEGINTEDGLADVNQNLCAMVTAGTKFTAAKNFTDVVRKYGSTNRDNIKFLLADPKSDELKKLSSARALPEDSINKLVSKNLYDLKMYKDFLHVRFYPQWYKPLIRAFFVDDRYVLFSFYTPGETGEKSPQLKIIKTTKRSFYNAFKDIFDLLWNNGMEVNWNEY